MPGNNTYPNVDNYPVPSFKVPVTAPDVDPDEGAVVVIGLNPEWIPVVEGALDQLLLPSSWKGDHDEKLLAIERAANLKMIVGSGDVGDVGTPFWDDETDVDDEATPEDQTWYGTVTDPEAPPGELDFVENALIWLFTGLLAVSGTPAAAIAFHTVAPRFVLAMRGGDLGEVIRIIVDGQETARVDTTGHAGEIVEATCIGDPALDSHDIFIVKVS